MAAGGVVYSETQSRFASPVPLRRSWNPALRDCVAD
jgi:hypothetical protein